ncbi:hypothetical protein EVAR_78108_1 [Eumeta japonica]|uniref:Uncharacterized protein n=1 Tax=Eumeta variegata TaxID=151549 RepID=A0A4C1T0G1_EUMVA|nr:hypothetical protein EVAR_78108_1 [Eumeta japonica]
MASRSVASNPFHALHRSLPCASRERRLGECSATVWFEWTPRAPLPLLLFFVVLCLLLGGWCHCRTRFRFDAPRLTIMRRKASMASVGMKPATSRCTARDDRHVNRTTYRGFASLP